MPEKQSAAARAAAVWLAREFLHLFFGTAIYEINKQPFRMILCRKELAL
jgi:hypothetical protein